jgi:hypothetical protein
MSMRTYVFTVPVSVHDNTEAGDVAVDLAEATSAIGYDVGAYELTEVRTDPDATLAELREAYAAEDFERAAVLANDLDMWIVRGGTLPQAWM